MARSKTQRASHRENVLSCINLIPSSSLHVNAVAAAKIKTVHELRPLLRKARSRGLRIVFTNGCFDVLHRGHLTLLRRARELGDVLIVAVDDDASVRRLKGDTRPVHTLTDRVEMLAALEMVDYVTCFANAELCGMIHDLAPDVLVKGDDWRREDVVGREVVEANGGEVVIVPRLPRYSSTGLIERIREQ